MDTKLNRLRLEKLRKPAAVTAVALSTLALGACTSESVGPRVVTAVCSSEQSPTPHAGETFGALVTRKVGGDALAAFGATKLTKALEAHQNEFGKDFTINSATRYDGPPIMTNASIPEKIPQECTVVDVDGAQ